MATTATRPAVKVIGFDLGHGETALAFAQADNNAEPTLVELPGASRRQHITAVAQDADGQVVVGEDALRTPEPLSLYAAFKGPELSSDAVSRPTKLFVDRIARDIVANGTIGGVDEVRWFFGAPSGWPRDAYRQYEMLLVEAGLPHVVVVPESRAALLYARHSGEIKLANRRIVQGVMIADFGSSTTDYTYVHELRQTPIDHGNVHLGACLIDREIMRLVIARNPMCRELQRLVEDHPPSRRLVELFCRKAKEEFFRHRREDLLRRNSRVGAIEEIQLPSGDTTILDIRLSVADMDAVLNAPQDALHGRSWRQAFSEDIQKSLAEAPATVDLVLLTGGPSRMPFIVETCRELVGEQRVVLGNEPEVAIARGLALAGRMTIRAAGLRADVNTVKDRIRPIVEKRVPDLATAMAAAVAEKMTERHVIPAFVAWRNSEIRSVEEMVERVVSGVQADLGAEDDARTAKVTVAWQNKIRTEVDNITRPICNRWFIEPGALSLPSLTMRTRPDVAVQVPDSLATSHIGAAAHAVNAIVATVVATTLFGAGTAIIASTGPFAVIIAFGAAMGLLAMGRAEAMNKIRSANMWSWARKLKSEKAIIDKLRSSAPTSEAALAAELSVAFASELRAEVVDEVCRTISDQLDKVADEAELLIA